jgi:hypothetical protein
VAPFNIRLAQDVARKFGYGIISNQLLQRGSTPKNFPAIAQSNWLKTSVFLGAVCREELSGASR